MRAEPGSFLGPYQIVERLGAGGMGEVFRATDPRLSRDVAVKILHPDRLDTKRFRQFETEARAAGALSHPNVLVVHDVGTHDGIPYVVTELLSGETLQRRIAAGGLTPRKALDLAVQIADGLAAAHAKGIVHRDLKPANLFVTDEGRLKILDFGLATLRAPGGDPASSTASTRTSAPLVGTPAYMSPEQVKALPTDARSDIFSFGIVVYEMLASRKPFPGPSHQAMAAIVASDPTPLVNAPGLTRALWPIINRCLEKRPADRFQSAHDLKLALGAVAESGSGDEETPARRRVSPRVVLAMLGVVVVTAAVGWSVRTSSRRELTFSSPRAATTLAGAEESPTLSPDGSQVAFVWNDDRPGVRRLYVKAVAAPDALALTAESDGEVWSPAWSPDGQRIAFLRSSMNEAGYAVIVMPPLGGVGRRVSTVTSIEGLSWSPDGAFLALADSAIERGPQGIVLLSVESGEKRRLSFPPETTHRDAMPAFSPDGRTVAYRRSRSGGSDSSVLVQPIDSDKGMQVVSLPAVVLDLEWMPDGSGLLVLTGGAAGDRELWKVPLDNAQRVRLPFSTDAHHVSISQSGRRLAYSVGQGDCNIWRVDGPAASETRPPNRVIASSRMDFMPQFSPDGARVAFVSMRAGGLHLWTCTSEGKACHQLTTTGVAVMPAWAPNGERIAFVERAGNADIAIVDATGGVARRLTDDAAEDVTPEWSRDGQSVYFASDRTGNWEIWKVSVRDGRLRQITKTGGVAPHESLDGHSLYYAKPKDETIWRVNVDGTEERLASELRIWPGYWALWRDDLIHLSGADRRFERHDMRRGGVTTVSRLAGNTDLCTSPWTAFAVSPDGQSILYSQGDLREGDVFVVDVLR